MKRFVTGILLMGCLPASSCIEAEAPAVQVRPAESSSIEGTYRLMHRKLADGIVLTEPDAIGMLTFANGYRNFNLYLRDRDGNIYSYSIISVYELSETEYAEKILYSAVRDETAGGEVVYQVHDAEAAVPVVRDGDAIRIDLPFDPVTATFEGDRLVAEGPDFIDLWQRVDSK